MFSLVALALASSINTFVVPRANTPSDVPPMYAQGYLEDYHTYHARYMALNCQVQHNTPFFDDCCHPMLATENLKYDRKPYCTPSPSSSTSAVLAEPTNTEVPSDNDECPHDDEDTSSAELSPASAAAPEDATSMISLSPDPTPTPEPSSASKKPEPNPSSTSSSKATKSTSNESGGEYGLGDIIGEIFNGGIATFFFQNGVAGNCGTVHSDNDKVVALQTSTYANGIHCGKKIRIKDNMTGKTAVGTVADSCPTCRNPQSIDLSHSLFHEFASDDAGIFDVSWGFI